MLKFNLSGGQERERNPEAVGRNVELRLIFARHGEKDRTDKVHGRLTAAGEEQFRQFAAKELNDPNRSLVVYGTDIMRTIQSGLVAKEKSSAKVKVEPAYLDELSLNLGSQDPSRQPKISGGFMEEVSQMPSDKNVQYFLSFGDRRPDEKTFSPHELAAGLAKIISGYDKKIGQIKSQSQTDVLLVSHDFLLSAFLQVAMKIMPDEGKEAIDLAEAFYVTIKTDNEGKHKVIFSFRDHTIDLDMEKIEELANYKYEEKS